MGLRSATSRIWAARTTLLPFVFLTLGAWVLAFGATRVGPPTRWLHWPNSADIVSIISFASGFLLFAVALGRVAWRRRLALAFFPTFSAGSLATFLGIIGAICNSSWATHFGLAAMSFTLSLLLAGTLSAVIDKAWRADLGEGLWSFHHWVQRHRRPLPPASRSVS
jgi:hypothetical protein